MPSILRLRLLPRSFAVTFVLNWYSWVNRLRKVVVSGLVYSPASAHSQAQAGSRMTICRFDPESGHTANRGLGIARNLLEPIKMQFPWITYAGKMVIPPDVLQNHHMNCAILTCTSQSCAGKDMLLTYMCMLFNSFLPCLKAPVSLHGKDRLACSSKHQTIRRNA